MKLTVLAIVLAGFACAQTPLTRAEQREVQKTYKAATQATDEAGAAQKRAQSAQAAFAALSTRLQTTSGAAGCAISFAYKNSPELFVWVCPPKPPVADAKQPEPTKPEPPKAAPKEAK